MNPNPSTDPLASAGASAARINQMRPRPSSQMLALAAAQAVQDDAGTSPRDPAVAPAHLQHLASRAQTQTQTHTQNLLEPDPGRQVHPPHQATSLQMPAQGTFSATILPVPPAPYPPASCLQRASGLAPGQRLAQAHALFQTLRDTLGQPLEGAANASRIDDLAACLVGLDCSALSIMSAQLPSLQNMRADSANPQHRQQLLTYLGFLEQGVVALTQANPALSVVDTPTPEALRAFLEQQINAFSRAMEAGNPVRALELLAAMEEQSWRHDPDQSAYPGIFNAMTSLTAQVWARTLTPQDVDAARRAFGELPGGISRVSGTAGMASGLATSGLSLQGVLPLDAAFVGAQCAAAGNPQGSLLLDIWEYVQSLKVPGKSKGLKFQAVRLKIMERFSISSDIATHLYVAVKNKNRRYDGLPALFSNVNQPTLVQADALGEGSDEGALDAIFRYQQAEGARSGWPIAEPTHAQLLLYGPVAKRHADHWIRILWRRGAALETRVSGEVTAIEQAITAAGAFEESGVYMPVRDLLGADPKANIRMMAALNRNANYYRSGDDHNFSVRGQVTRRQHPASHNDIERDMLELVKAQPTSASIDRGLFASLGYPPIYIDQRLDQLCQQARMTRIDGRYVLFQEASAATLPKAVRRQAGQPRQAAEVLDPADGEGPRRKKRRLDTAPASRRATSTGHPLTLQHPPNLPNLPNLPTGPAGGALVRPDGLPSDLAVQQAAHAARIPGYFNSDLGDLHTHALVTAIARDYDVNISILRDNPAYAGLANRPPPMVYPAPGGAARPVIRLRNEIVVDASSHDTAHYEFAVQGVHGAWQRTRPDGDCLYESVGRALQAAGLEPGVLAVGVMRDYVAREIGSNLDAYRPALTDGSLQELLMLPTAQPPRR
ncbi:MAG: hypothetical protein EOO28_05835 [Comamonadaceae bacterium]|nr:MAG: hypothetical protein EOO28_05835 [Comamonadaceae bacterium]